MKTLVVYFSRKGYVESLALETAKKLGADTLRLCTPEPTEGILGFWWCGRFAMHRWGMKLLSYETDVASYDRVIVCSPIWAFSVCAPVRQFLINENGNIKAAEYLLVHYSTPMKYKKTVAKMDELAGVRHEKYTSVCCPFGQRLRIKEFQAEH